LEVAAARMPECSPLGAALAGSVGMGLRDMTAIGSLAREAVTYAPRMPAEQSDRLYRGWKRAVGQVLAGVGTA
jgi:glycerol kinase